MQTKSTSIEVLIIASVLAPFAYLSSIWHQLPATVATHYTLQGNPDDYMPKETSAWFVGGISVVLYLVLRFLPAIDPKGRMQTANYQKLRLVISLSFALIMGWMWYVSAHHTDTRSFLIVVLALVGLMLAGMGNYLTTVKPNWFVGIRTPWTLENEVVWRKTHRLGGRLMVIGGLLSAALAFIVPMPYTVGVVLGVILVSSLLPVVYSYVYFREEKTHQLH